MSQKTIQINPEYLAMANGGGKKQKTQKRHKKQKPIAPPKHSNKMRKELLGRIKDFQKKKEDELSDKQLDKSSEEDFQNEFNRSLNFLQDLSKRKTEKQRRNSTKQGTLKQPRPNISVEAPKEMFEINTASLDKKSAFDYHNNNNNNHNNNNNNNNTSIQKQNISLSINDKDKQHLSTELIAPPPYGALKGGNRPTFREWKRMTQKDYNYSEQKPMIQIDDNGCFDKKETTEREHKLKALKDKVKSSRPTKATRIKTMKYRLGKVSDKHVAVLIKNNTTRKRIQAEHGALKTQSIIEVKNYLRKKNLLKVGSNAPNDVLRQLYEQSILAGDIINSSDDTLMHNYLSKEI